MEINNEKSNRFLKVFLYLANNTSAGSTCTQQDIIKMLKRNEISCAEDTLTKIILNMIEIFNPKIYDDNDGEYVIKFQGWKDYNDKLESLERAPKITNIYFDVGAFENWLKKNIHTYSSDVYFFQAIDEKIVRENVDKITKAIKEQQMIEFDFASGKHHKVSPFYVVNYYGKTFLLCNRPPYEDVGIYRVDMISNIVITEEKAKNVREQKEFEGSISPPIEFMEKHINATYGEIQSCVLKVKTKYRAIIDDNFGGSIEREIKIDDDFTEFHVKATEKGIVDLAFSACDKLEIIRPEKFIKSLKEKLQAVSEHYWYLEQYKN